MGDPLFLKELRNWIETADYDHEASQMIRSAVCSRIAKRQAPRGNKNNEKRKNQ